MAVAVAALVVAVVALVVFLFGVLIAVDLLSQRQYHELVSGWRDWALAVALLVVPVGVWAGMLWLHAARMIG
ncbi:MAG TPA: hypothetical protein VGR57_09405 [Ktedonobacterales bacterium]|nr:hypothetical protein [Ktedonobacterales bacterium]